MQDELASMYHNEIEIFFILLKGEELLVANGLLRNIRMPSESER